MGQQRLRDQFLQAAWEIAQEQPNGWVMLDQVANHVDLDTSDPNYVNKLDNIALYWGQREFIQSQADGYGVFSFTAKGIDYVEGNEPGQQLASVSNVFNFSGSNIHGSVIGTHNTAELTNSFDFQAIEQQIEREGGEDKEELKRALAQVERLLERGEYLDRGALAQFSGAMERHSWFTGSVMQALLGFATQAAG